MYGWSPNEEVHPDHEALSALMKTKYSPSQLELTISSDPIVTGMSLGFLAHPGTTAAASDNQLLKRCAEGQMVRVVAPPPSSPVKARTP
jgi:hypothetical protein